jgi:hypothetical protein
MRLPNGPSIWPTRPIVSAVLCGNNVWHQEPKEIAPGVSVRCAVSCLPLRLYLLSESRSNSDRSGGWMCLVERFAAPGSPTGAGNMSRCFRLRIVRRAFPFPLAHHGLCVRITAGVGTIGSHAMLGGDHRSGASLSLAFPLFSSPASSRRKRHTKRLNQGRVISL